MPPENTNPVAGSEVSEFEFDKPQTANPRIRKRNLKVKPAAESAAAQPASTASASAPAPMPDQPRAGVYAQPASSAGAPRATTSVRPSTGAPTAPPAAQPSGVLYYSNGPHKEASMNTSPQAARPASTGASQPIPQRTAAAAAATAAHAPINRSAAPTPSSASNAAIPSTGYRPPTSSAASTTSHASTHQAGASHSASSSPRPSSSTASPTSGTTVRALSTTVAGPSSSSKPAGVSDFRNNIDRQSREQKSIGGILNGIVYGLIAFFVIGAALAAYGAHDVYRQLHSQSVTVSDLDSRYAAANEQLNEQLKITEQSVIQLQGQLAHSQELALKQQDALTKLQAALDAETASLREERATRSAETSIRESETAALRARVRTLEKNEIPFHP